MQQLMSEQDFCRKAIIETFEILRELTHITVLQFSQL